MFVEINIIKYFIYTPLTNDKKPNHMCCLSVMNKFLSVYEIVKDFL